ncbi:MAG: hypothetical protein U0U25_12765 [Flavobacteriales bacterium]
MSWDIYIQDLPPVDRVDAIPEDFRPQPIGEREALIARIRKVLPMLERQDNDWLFAKGNGIDLSMQLHMEDATQVRYILVHVHNRELGAAGVAALLREPGLRAMDTATGDLFDAVMLEEGL